MPAVRQNAMRAIRAAARFVSRRRLSRHRELAELMKSMSASSSAAIDLTDAVVLYEHVLSARPRQILELGGGTSSAVIAQAIQVARRSHSTYQPRFVAVEDKEDWLDYHRRHTPQRLAACIEWVAGRIERTVVNGVAAAVYRGLPPMTIEFLHVDGPDLRTYGVAVSADAIELLDQFAPTATIAFDGREATARFAADALRQAGFRFRRQPLTLNHWFVR